MTHLYDNLKAYETAIAKLRSNPEDLNSKHAAVLALARAGSLDFALTEYARFGLNDIRHHEDIMSLGGRLYKDLYLSHTGKEAQQFARLSADKYEAAYQDTGGFYSGINAATMSLLGGIPEEMIKMRAERLLENLPAISNNDQDVYFTEASRAEAHLLLGDEHDAWASLKRALNYDPLNFAAHASTLKQFAMIARARGKEISWLSDFTPPCAVHFSGHMFGLENEVKTVPVLSKDEIEGLKNKISNLIQTHDIGFGSGALAAGADIMIAEGLLEEGGELHVVLPVEKQIFIDISVAPFGASWVPRFEACLAQARSVKIFEDRSEWPDITLIRRASLMAMGGAVRRSDALAVNAGQLVIWDGKDGVYGTAQDVTLWKNSGRMQHIIPYSAPRQPSPYSADGSPFHCEVYLAQDGSDAAEINPTPIKAIKKALEARRDKADLIQMIAIKLSDLSSQNSSNLLHEAGNLPGVIYLNELAANYIAIHHDADFAISYMGQNQQGCRIFALQERG